MTDGSSNRRAAPCQSDWPACIAVVGLGLMGGSLALALRRRFPGVRILGCSRSRDELQGALQRGMIDSGSSTDPGAVLPAADLTVLCVPLEATIEFAQTHASLWRAGALVTDIGSIKAAIVQGVSAPLRERGVHFIGSHPMAGTENSGLANALPDLYDGAVVFVTHTPGDAADALQAVVGFWRQLGAEPFVLPPDSHDMLVARTSHVLHLLAYAAARAYIVGEESELATGGGFRDFTRIAASSPAMWQEIFRLNRANVLAALDEFLADIDSLKTMIEAGDWDGLTQYLSAARDARRAWFARWQQRRGGVRGGCMEGTR